MINTICGIAYKHNFDGSPVNNDILNQYSLQKHRGADGFGLFDGEHQHLFHAAQEDRILRWFTKYDSSLLMFHHRYPTTTENVKRAAHPFSTKAYFGKTQYILVHNGGVENAVELKGEHGKLGIDYYSILGQDKDGEDVFNDSEAFLWDFALFMEGKQKKLTARGPCAFMCMKLVDGELEKLYFARNYLRPLRIDRTPEGIEVSSEGYGFEVLTGKLHTWHYKLNRLTERKMGVPIPASIYQSYLNNDSYDEYGNYIGSGYVYKGTPSKAYAWNSNEELKRTGNWLGEELRKKFARIYPPFRDEIGKQTSMLENVSTSPPIDYTKDEKSGLYLPDGSAIGEEAYLEELAPTDTAVIENALRYLTEAEGNFDGAYWALEADYEVLGERPDTADNIKERILLERTLDYIENDPEFETTRSVSSLWETLCQQNS